MFFGLLGSKRLKMSFQLIWSSVNVSMLKVS